MKIQQLSMWSNARSCIITRDSQNLNSRNLFVSSHAKWLYVCLATNSKLVIGHLSKSLVVLSSNKHQDWVICTSHRWTLLIWLFRWSHHPTDVMAKPPTEPQKKKVWPLPHLSWLLQAKTMSSPISFLFGLNDIC